MKINIKKRKENPGKHLIWIFLSHFNFSASQFYHLYTIVIEITSQVNSKEQILKFT